MYCLGCGKWFDRGTDALPNFCNKCLKYIRYETIEITSEEQIENYINMIESCENEIKECIKTIDKNTEIIKNTKHLIDTLRT